MGNAAAFFGRGRAGRRGNNDPLTLPACYFASKATHSCDRGLEMGMILQFPTEAARRTRRPASSAGPRGEIVFFTGVRIERHVDETIEPDFRDLPPSKGSRRKA
jgi:hypothetical protein